MTTNYNKLISDDDPDFQIQDGFLDDDMDIPLINSISVRGDVSMTTTCASILCPLQENQNHMMNSYNSHDESTKAKTKMMIAAVLCFLFMVTEFIGGYIAGSLAIMTDAAHLTSDCISFLIGIASIWISKKPPDNIMSFGYKRIEVFGAVTSILAIWFLTAFLVYLAVGRIINNNFNIDANSMMIASSIGICMNISMAFTLHGSCFSGLNFAHSHNHGHGHHQSKCNNSKSKNSENHSNLIHQHEQTSSAVIDVENEVPVFVATRATNITNEINSNRLNNNNNSKDFPSVVQQVENNNSRIHSESNGDAILTEILGNSQHDHLSNHSHKSSGRNLNLQAAIIHVIGDFIQSVGVFIASIVIKLEPSAKIADPICTILFSFLVILTTVKIMKESIYVLLDAVPHSISVENIENDLKNLEGIKSVHQLNVWSLSTNHHILTVHLIIEENIDSEIVLKLATHLLKTKYNIKETTLQIERIRNDENH